MSSWRGLALAAVAIAAAVLVFLLLRSPGTEPQRDEDFPPETMAAPPAPQPAGEVRVYFSRGDTSASVTRPVSGEPGPEAALRALLAGPTDAERAAGVSSWFSAETASLLNSFAISPDSIAHVDFGDLAAAIPSASSSAGSEVLLRELNSTLFRYPDVKAIEYTVNGSCEAFWNWLQYDCEIVTRVNRER